MKYPSRRLIHLSIIGLFIASQGRRRCAVLGGLVLSLALGQRTDARPREAFLTPTPVPDRTGSQATTGRGSLLLSANPTTREISRARVFEEPLAPIGKEPTSADNAALSAALLTYAARIKPDDFTGLTEFVGSHPASPWRAAVLTCLGLEYYNTAYYSRALQAWEQAWSLAKEATDLRGKGIADRAVGELAYLYARLGRMTDLQALLTSIENRTFVGAATERLMGAREGLWNMQNRPEVSFKCGPYALMRILQLDSARFASKTNTAVKQIFDFPSTQKGCSLPQVAGLSHVVGLNFQMAFREKEGEFIVPSVVHWKVGHYAALVRQEGDTFLLEDPTFGNTVWATRKALEAETSGYFLIPPGGLRHGWRSVAPREGSAVWGKGQTGGNDPKPHGPDDPKKPDRCDAESSGMAVADVHLMLVSLNITDTPVGYAPPVGSAVKCKVTYNQRDAFQPANFTYSNFGPKWTCDWIAYITDNPQSPSANVNQYLRGGGTREFSGFDSNSNTFSSQPYDQTRLARTGPNSYELMARDGSKLIFGRPDGTAGTARKVFLTQSIDASGNTVTLTYDGDSRLTAVSDAIGQATTLSYGDTNDLYKVTRVTDPFGRFAQFSYDSQGRLTNITDVVGLNSAFVYEGAGDFINALVTPYGTTSFSQGPAGNIRFLETVYPDGSRDRVEYTQFVTGTSNTQREASVPSGMATANDFLSFRNTFYWSRTACATSYGDYSKARVYHWLHAEDPTKTAGILESVKDALEGRVWYDYAGQSHPTFVGANNRPIHIGRVLDDGTTQLYTYSYNSFGQVTRMVDPVGRTLSYVYATNGIDLLEVRQTRASKNDLISRTTYNAQHQPLTRIGADGQTNAWLYNERGQVLAETNPKGEAIRHTYDLNGYLIASDGALPGTNDVVTFTHDRIGRLQSKTDVNGYTLSYQHDDLDRLTRVVYPDGSFESLLYDRLDVSAIRDRAGRQTVFEFDSQRQMKRKTDPLGRVTTYEWCRCGAIKSLTDPMNRTTSWVTDVQSRPTVKQYADGSQVQYVYESSTSRLGQIIDEKGQISQFTYNPDDSLKSIVYLNAQIPTPGVSYTYDPDYQRRVSMTDGTGVTHFSYHPVTTPPLRGANQLASVDGPLADDTITYEYDELGRRVSTAINGTASRVIYDAAGRAVSETNALGTFTFVYDGSSRRMLTNLFPNGLAIERAYGDNLADRELERITHRFGGQRVSEFRYGRDHLANRITTWSQQEGSASATVQTFSYDAGNQLLAAAVTNAGVRINSFAYTYDALGNRLSEQVGESRSITAYNALNQLTTTDIPGGSHTNEWDAKDRLVAVNAGSQRTEFAYDGMDHVVSIRTLTDGKVSSFRRFVWCDDTLCEERDSEGRVAKRFFVEGIRLENGPNAGDYFYVRDHLGSIHQIVDREGKPRGHYTYDPFGRRAKVSGDFEADFGFTGLFFTQETGLHFARYRAYDANLGRWLARDPLANAEMQEGPNLYIYVKNDPVNLKDPSGLYCCEPEDRRYTDTVRNYDRECPRARQTAELECRLARAENPKDAKKAALLCSQAQKRASDLCDSLKAAELEAEKAWRKCLKTEKCEMPQPRICIMGL